VVAARQRSLSLKCARGALAVDVEVDDTSANCEVIGLSEINEVESAVGTQFTAFSTLFFIVGVEDAVLEAETCKVAIAGEDLLEFSKEFLFLCLLADGDLLIVCCGVTQVLGFVAILRGCLKVINMQLLEGVGEVSRVCTHSSVG
jgi:hypothetical protein